MCELCIEAMKLWKKVDDGELTMEERAELSALAEAALVIPGPHRVGMGVSGVRSGGADVE